MLQLKQLSVQYGDKVLFADVDLLLQPGNRYGLVGANGSGKSTLLRLIAGQEIASNGNIELANKSSIGFLKQDQFRYENDRIVDVVVQGKPLLWQAIQEKEALVAQEQLTEQDGYRLAELEEVIAQQDGYTAEHFACRLLTGLGIRSTYHERPLSCLSGGFKLRVLLAQVLFQQPDVLLLDEPTNHLDIVSIHWLKNYLRNEFQGLLLFVSHDRDFLNGLATHILDVDYGTILLYVGNYDQFLAEKERIHTQKLQERQHVEKKIATMQANVERFRYKASRARQAQSKLKRIDRIIENERVELKSSSRIAPAFQFTPQRPSGKQVLKVEGINKTFDDNRVLCNVSFSIKRGEKVAVIGSNGIGKSTLLRIILNRLPMDGGYCEWGYETQVAYFAQDHHELLKTSSSVYDWLQQQVAQEAQTKVRQALGRMLFSGEMKFKRIYCSSAVEKLHVC